MSRARREKKLRTRARRERMETTCLRLGLPKNAWKKRLRIAGVSMVAVDLAARRLGAIFREFGDRVIKTTEAFRLFGEFCRRLEGEVR